MYNLRVHTEYSFRMAYGKIKDIIENSKQECVAITDKFTTFGHIPFWKLCKKNNKKPILGIELSFVENCKLKAKQPIGNVVLLAINNKGLNKIYELATKASENKYYIPRCDFNDLRHLLETDVIVILLDEFCSKYVIGRNNTYLGMSPLTFNPEYIKLKKDFPLLAISDNNFDVKENEILYQIVMGEKAFEQRVEKSWLLNEEEWKKEVYWLNEKEKEECIQNTKEISNKIEYIEFQQAHLPKLETEENLKDLCLRGFRERGIDSENKKYKERLEYELNVIKIKDFEEYFLIVYDLVNFAKPRMLIGPGRGSAAGSLVCYLLGITEIDPLKFNLFFERFIDLTRKDLPDIDLDFADIKRDECFDYLKSKYGSEKVARLGTISKYKPDSLLLEFSKLTPIDKKLIEQLKGSMLDFGPVGDLSDKCLQETFRLTEAGKKIIEIHPEIKIIEKIEGHNRHHGTHAAGVIVADKPLQNYCAQEIDADCCQLDKFDAEIVNLLKIDCLGLRTLSVIHECLNFIKKDKEWLLKQSIEDQKAFDILNDGKFSGIFQFEGITLQNLCSKIRVDKFEDISHLTALARPGPLRSGGTAKYAQGGKHMKGCEKILEETRGIIVYQEQIMTIAKEIGKMDWEQVSKLRKAVSKSLGKEVMNTFYNQFSNGAEQNGLKKVEIDDIWEGIIDAGAYAFNKAHSVSYAMVSYWCMYLKAYFPLEFALATLKNSKSEEQTIQIIIELLNENYEIKLFDKDLSDKEWSLKNGILYGGYTNIKGCGTIKADKIIKKRKKGEPLSVSEIKTIFNPVTPYDKIFESREFISKLCENWKKYFLEEPKRIKDILKDQPEEIGLCFYILDTEEKKNGKGKGFIKITACDGTGVMICYLCGREFEQFKEVIQKENYYLTRGNFLSEGGNFFIKKIKKIDCFLK